MSQISANTTNIIDWIGCCVTAHQTGECPEECPYHDVVTNTQDCELLMMVAAKKKIEELDAEIKRMDELLRKYGDTVSLYKTVYKEAIRG